MMEVELVQTCVLERGWNEIALEKKLGSNYSKNNLQFEKVGIERATMENFDKVKVVARDRVLGEMVSPWCYVEV